MIIAVVHSKIPLFSRSRCAWNSFRQKHNCVMTQFNAKWINLTLYTTENHTTPQYVLMPSLLTSCSKLKKAFTDSNQVWYSPVWSKWLFNHLVGGRGKSLGPRDLFPLWSQVRTLWLLIWWPLEAYMVVNFRVRGISRGARKLVRTPTLN